jgi:beta-lactamase regulating signal transducer with metallopeptidase domain
VTEHLIVSTVFLGLAMIVVRFVPMTARTRYAVLLCGLAKFAVPTAVFRFVPAEVIPAQLRTLGGGTPVVLGTPASRVDWILIAWATIALLFFARWLVLRSRTISSALRSPGAASKRELDAVREARRTLNVGSAVDVIRSPICEAPAVLRILRPVIALPSHGCDELTGDELRSLVLHECAHVKRNDNLAALMQALATSLLWFHPLVWLASSRITVAREEACDESVADAMETTDAYVSALAKICRAILAPRAAGASCMASAKLKERMEHLMDYDSIKGKAWSHRAMIAIGVVLIAASTFAATRTSRNRPYSLTFNVTSMGSQSMYQMQVIDNASGAVVNSPKVTKGNEVRARIEWTDPEGRNFTIDVVDAPNGSPEVTLVVAQRGKELQRTLYTQDLKTYDGEPISMSLKDADIRDVLQTFGDLTGLKLAMTDDVQGTVTTKLVNVPWDKALDDMLTQHGLIAEVDGSTLRVKKR